jgi:hypothetical protein
VQGNPIKLTLKVPGTKRLKLEYYRLVSNFTFIFNLRCYTKDTFKAQYAAYVAAGTVAARADTRSHCRST